MLRELEIRNFTLIDHLHVDFHSGFSVITGETGAGKSIILGAIGLLTGNRADTKSLKHADKKCIVEAHFNIEQYDFRNFFIENDIDYDPNDCILRREITPTGKSRGFINDIPVALNTMRQLGEQLIDIHSQHQNLLLKQEDFQLDVLDIVAQNDSVLSQFSHVYAQLRKAEHELAEEQKRIDENKGNEDYLRFQLEELDAFAPTEGEEEELEQESAILSHAEDIREGLFTADNLLQADNGIIVQTKQALQAVNSVVNLLPQMPILAERLDSCYIEMRDIQEEIGTLLNRSEYDPKRLDEIQERLSNLASLKKKHHADTVSELINLQNQIRSQIDAIDNSDEILEELTKHTEELRKACLLKANELHKARENAARKIEKYMESQLRLLGIPNVNFAVEIKQSELTSKGTDKTAFLFSANKNAPLQPISAVASGGEIARVMLCLKSMISGARKLPTIIFDEIDTGVSGSIAEKMGSIMRDMDEQKRQVISITHLPQIAALGRWHYKVEKHDTEESTVSNMRLLSDEERITEIAQMLSGSSISAAAIENAKNLLKQ